MRIELRPFLSIAETARITGLSQTYLRKGVRAGEIQHIMSGTKYMVNLPAFFSSLGLPWPQVISEATPGLHSGGHGDG